MPVASLPSTLENGRRDPHVSTLLAVAKALRIEPAELTTSSGAIPPTIRPFSPSTPGATRTHDPRLRRHPDLGTNIEKSGDRDGVVTAIVGALSSAAAREPQALSRCVEALGLALGALMQSAGENATGTDDGERAGPPARVVPGRASRRPGCATWKTAEASKWAGAPCGTGRGRIGPATGPRAAKGSQCRRCFRGPARATESEADVTNTAP
jgi:hypothetical protein